MSLFSKTCEYGIRAVLYIASQSANGRKVGIKEITENINSPEHFLAKILQKLSKDGIILSSKGPNGGFSVSKEILLKPMADIIVSLEGDSIFRGCAMGLSNCSEVNPCPLHNQFKSIRNQLTDTLYNNSIGNFNEGLLSGACTLNK